MKLVISTKTRRTLPEWRTKGIMSAPVTVFPSGKELVGFDMANLLTN